MPVLPSRLQRLTHSLKHGAKILAFLQEPNQVSKMITAAEKGVPSVVGISQPLLDRFGADVKLNSYKQFTGMAVRWILEQHSFQLLDQGVKTPGDPVYASGSRYSRTPSGEASALTANSGEQPDLLERFVAVLHNAELHRLIEIAQTRLANH